MPSASAFRFTSAGRIEFGVGVIEQLPALARGYGARALVVTGAPSADALA